MQTYTDRASGGETDTDTDRETGTQVGDQAERRTVFTLYPMNGPA